MVNQIELEKIAYFMKYTGMIQSEMMTKLVNGKNVLYNFRSILLSALPLIQCEEYEMINLFLNQYGIEKEEYISPITQFQGLLSVMNSFEQRGGESIPNQKILEYQKNVGMLETSKIA